MLSLPLEKVIIVGSGCAGLTAAIYAARANLSPLVLEGPQPGGQLSTTTLVENYPGFPDGIDGPQLIINMHQQAEKFGARFSYSSVEDFDVSGDGGFDHRQRRIGPLVEPGRRTKTRGSWTDLLRDL